MTYSGPSRFAVPSTLTRDDGLLAMQRENSRLGAASQATGTNYSGRLALLASASNCCKARHVKARNKTRVVQRSSGGSGETGLAFGF